MDMHGRRRRGFTLIELLVVIAIIAILVAILMPVIGSVQEKARQARCSANIMQIATALKAYKTDYGRYPFRPYYDSAAGIYMGGPSALYPDYITDKAVLICPNDAANFRGMSNTPPNYSSYSGLVAGFVPSLGATGADYWRFAAQDATGEHPNAVGSATVYCCITYNYGGFNNYGWDRSYWDNANSRWASEWPAGGAAPGWLSAEGKKWRHYPRLMNRRCPDNTIAVRCRCHHKWYGRDETSPAGSQETQKWRDVYVQAGGDADTIDYFPWTQVVTAGASQWRIQE